jgi:hypothetical protein
MLLFPDNLLLISMLNESDERREERKYIGKPENLL